MGEKRRGNKGRHLMKMYIYRWEREHDGVKWEMEGMRGCGRRSSGGGGRVMKNGERAGGGYKTREI